MAEGLRFETLTGLELRKLAKVLGRPVTDASRDGDLEIAFGLEWIRQTRDDPSVKFEDVLALPFGDVIYHLEGVDEEDPTTGRSGAH